MTKHEILQELDEILCKCLSDVDITQFVITGKAANVLLTNKDDQTINDINIWVNKKYYDIILRCGEYEEFNDEGIRYIPFSYLHRKDSGFIKLYRGNRRSKPKYKKINGYNVQIFCSEETIANSNKDKFKVIK